MPLPRYAIYATYGVIRLIFFASRHAMLMRHDASQYALIAFIRMPARCCAVILMRACVTYAATLIADAIDAVALP